MQVRQSDARRLARRRSTFTVKLHGGGVEGGATTVEVENFGTKSNKSPEANVVTSVILETGSGPRRWVGPALQRHCALFEEGPAASNGGIGRKADCGLSFTRTSGYQRETGDVVRQPGLDGVGLVQRAGIKTGQFRVEACSKCPAEWS